MDKAIVYLHGTPGSPAELTLFGRADPRFHAPDRYTLSPGKDAKAAIDDLANDLSARFAGQPFHLIGFSMGGYIALQLAQRLGGRIAQIDLISSVAPFQGGDFMKDAVGGLLFALAQRQSPLFGLAIAVQHFAARTMPARFAAMLFASARGNDVELVQNPQFIAKISTIVSDSFAHGRGGYAREMIGVTKDWRDILPEIEAPIRMWHGTLDNWAPIGMATYLRATLPDVIEFNAIDGASHYSTLRTALADIAKRLP